MNTIRRGELPEGAVSGEGDSLNDAIRDAAKRLGLEPGEVEHALDFDHFHNDQGRSVGVDTVKVWVWPRSPELLEASRDARSWMEELLRLLDFGGEVEARIGDGEVLLRVHTEKAGHLVGRNGATLDAVRTLLLRTVGQRHPEARFVIDVLGSEEKAEPEARKRSSRRKKKGGRAEPEARAEGGRKAKKKGGGNEKSSSKKKSSGRLSKRDERALRRLAHKVAKRVLRTGEPELIRKELNSFARRVIHVTVAEYEGLKTESVGEGPHKQVRVVPLAPGEEKPPAPSSPAPEAAEEPASPSPAPEVAGGAPAEEPEPEARPSGVPAAPAEPSGTDGEAAGA